MATERTLSIIKPDATRRNLTGKINATLEAAGLRIVAQRRLQLTRAQAELRVPKRYDGAERLRYATDLQLVFGAGSARDFVICDGHRFTRGTAKRSAS